MASILIVYASDYGNTKRMAESVGKGASSIANCKSIIKAADEATAEDVLAADGLIIGSPVHMGSSDWRVKKFIDSICSRLWMKDLLIGRVGGVFVSGGGFGSSGGGCELTILSLLSNIAELGMLIVPLPKNTPGYKEGGIQWGPYGRSQGINMEPEGVTDDALLAAFHHGANIAKTAEAVKNQALFSLV